MSSSPCTVFAACFFPSSLFFSGSLSRCLPLSVSLYLVPVLSLSPSMFLFYKKTALSCHLSHHVSTLSSLSNTRPPLKPSSDTVRGKRQNTKHGRQEPAITQHPKTPRHKHGEAPRHIMAVSAVVSLDWTDKQMILCYFIFGFLFCLQCFCHRKSAHPKTSKYLSTTSSVSLENPFTLIPGCACQQEATNVESTDRENEHAS